MLGVNVFAIFLAALSLEAFPHGGKQINKKFLSRCTYSVSKT